MGTRADTSARPRCSTPPFAKSAPRDIWATHTLLNSFVSVGMKRNVMLMAKPADAVRTPKRPKGRSISENPSVSCVGDVVVMSADVPSSTQTKRSTFSIAHDIPPAVIIAGPAHQMTSPEFTNSVSNTRTKAISHANGFKERSAACTLEPEAACTAMAAASRISNAGAPCAANAVAMNSTAKTIFARGSSLWAVVVPGR